jgi:hypothetical protein
MKTSPYCINEHAAVNPITTVVNALDPFLNELMINGLRVLTALTSYRYRYKYLF